MSYKGKQNLNLDNITRLFIKKSLSGFKVFIFLYLNSSRFLREKGRDLTQSYDKSPFTNRNVKRAK